MPDLDRALELLDAGRRAEQFGALDVAIESFSEASQCDDPATCAEALARLADAHRSRADWSAALAAARRAQQIARSARLDALLAHAMIAEGNVLMVRGDFSDARRIFDQVLSLTADPYMRGLALQNIGTVLAEQGQLGAAERSFTESCGCFQRAGYRRGEAISLNNCGRVALDRGDYELASDLLRHALAVAREVEHAELVALATLNLAEAKMHRGEPHEAERFASEALGFFSSSGNRWREVECLRLLGAISEQAGDLENATRCYNRGLGLAQDLDAAVEVHTLKDCLARLTRTR
jgi:tetratricopeptide (TPR) repeat protein